MNEAERAAQEFRDEMMEKFGSDPYQAEKVERSFVYVMRRIEDGVPLSPLAVRAVMGAFADGFCTGYHRATGTPCQH